MASSPIAELAWKPKRKRKSGKKPRKANPQHQRDYDHGFKPVAPPVQEAVGTGEVCRRTGATARQLQFWDEQGLLRPWKNENHRRWYLPAQVERIERIMELLGLGVALQRALHLSKMEYDSVERIDGACLVGKKLIVSVPKD